MGTIINRGIKLTTGRSTFLDRDALRNSSIWPMEGNAGPWAIANPMSNPAVVNAVQFDGTNDFLTRGADFTGLANGSFGTFSGWFKFNAGSDGIEMAVFGNNVASLFIEKAVDNKWRVIGSNPGFTPSLDLTSSATTTVSSGWSHLLTSWNLTTGVGQLYINDVDALGSNTVSSGTTVGYNLGTDWDFASLGGSFKLAADVSEIWFSSTDFIDLTIIANRRKFIGSDFKPVGLGANGETPTGVSPIMYLAGNNTTFATNKGTGGGMTTTGALTAATTSPSD